MSSILSRGLTTVSVEAVLGTDDQGAPSYASPFDVDARVVFTTEMLPQPDGSQIRSTVTLWADAGQTPIVEQSRVIILGVNYIALQVDQLKRLDGTIDHQRVRLREEQH